MGIPPFASRNNTQADVSTDTNVRDESRMDIIGAVRGGREAKTLGYQNEGTKKITGTLYTHKADSRVKISSIMTMRTIRIRESRDGTGGQVFFSVMQVLDEYDFKSLVED